VRLSFATRRELASERVRDKVAACERANRPEARYPSATTQKTGNSSLPKARLRRSERSSVSIELKSFGKLVAELDRRKIVTKERKPKVAKYNGGIPFTYGPLAYVLKNRIYVGTMHHGGKRFKGEHQAILGRPTFERVQNLVKSNRIARRIRHSESGALLGGKLFDDKGNAMSPSFSAKNGPRGFSPS
jgi:site-specific DNA recombinase